MSEAAPNLPRRPSARILRAPEARAWQDGFAFLEEAKASADSLRGQAKRIYATEYARGYEEGRAAGAEEAARLLAETSAKVDAYLGSLQDQVSALAVDIVRNMLGDFDVTHLVAKAAAQATREIRRARYVRIRVHPDAVAAVRAEIDALVASGDPGFAIEVDGDESLAVTACTVTTEAAVVDASIEGQLAAFRNALASQGRP